MLVILFSLCLILVLVTARKGMMAICIVGLLGAVIISSQIGNKNNINMKKDVRFFKGTYGNNNTEYYIIPGELLNPEVNEVDLIGAILLYYSKIPNSVVLDKESGKLIRSFTVEELNREEFKPVPGDSTIVVYIDQDGLKETISNEFDEINFNGSEVCYFDYKML